ncbi:MAG: NADH-quinone oxidoreductase subunit C [bacterium]
MTPEEIYKKLQEKFGENILGFDGDALDPWVQIKPDKLFDAATFLKEEPDLSFTFLMCLSGMDYGAESDLGVVYHLFSMQHKHKITVRVDVPRDRAKVPSVEKIWRTADWHEREAYDLFGIVFDGHRDLRRILCPDDWEGYPLRKDYIVQEYYHGIRVPYQEDWAKHETFERNPERGHFVFKFEEKVPHLVNDKDSKKNGKDKSKE